MIVSQARLIMYNVRGVWSHSHYNVRGASDLPRGSMIVSQARLIMRSIEK